MTTTQTQDPEPTTPMTVTRVDDPRALRLTSVLASGLPSELGTPAEPALYTVPAVFSRQVTPAERARIEDPATAALLAEAAHIGPGLELTVADRRLLIANTNLAQLKNGLAAAIAAMLDRLGQELLTEQDRQVAAAEILRSGESARLATVARAAAEIEFGAVDDQVGPGYSEAEAAEEV